MDEERIEKLLNALASRTTEPVSSHLAEEIKRQIPPAIKTHSSGMDNFSIVINLRVSKLAAAAAIILTMVLWANLFDRTDSSNGGIYNDCKQLLRYHFAGSSELSLAKSRYLYLLEKGQKDVFFYGSAIDPKDSNAISLQWKLPDGNYRVVFSDLHETTVTPEELIKLQSLMLEKKSK